MVLYTAFCLAPGRELVVIEGGVTAGVAVTVRLRDLVALCELASVTRTVKLLVTLPDGVPEIAPLPAASASPAGSAPEAMDQL